MLFKRCPDVNDRVLPEDRYRAGYTQQWHHPERNRFCDHTGQRDHGKYSACPESLDELRQKIDDMLLGYTFAEMVSPPDLGVTGAITALLKDAAQPTLFKTLEGTPAMIPMAGPSPISPMAAIR